MTTKSAITSSRAVAIKSLLAAITLMGLVAPFQTSGQVVLKPGDILYADSGNAIEGGFIVKVDPQTGEETVVASGGYLRMPFAVTVDANGQVIASDSGRLIGIDPATGSQRILADNSSGTLGYPCGIAMDRSAHLLAANLQAVVQVDCAAGQIQTDAAGGNFLYPLGVAVGDNNNSQYVLNMAFPPQIIRVNAGGVQKVISTGGLLKAPQAIAIQGNDIYVTDVATSDGNFGIGRVIHIDAHTGTQNVAAEGRNLIGPVGIAVDANGLLIVGDPYTANPDNNGSLDGAIIRIDPTADLDSNQFVVARGNADHVNPRGVAIIPAQNQ
jgi:sugar lactone lactonase YvrE